MQMIGENVTDAQLNEMLALADLDKDGRINYEGKHRVLSMMTAFSKKFLFFSYLFRVCKIALVNGEVLLTKIKFTSLRMLKKDKF